MAFAPGWPMSNLALVGRPMTVKERLELVPWGKTKMETLKWTGVSSRGVVG